MVLTDRGRFYISLGFNIGFIVLLLLSLAFNLGMRHKGWRVARSVPDSNSYYSSEASEASDDAPDRCRGCGCRDFIRVPASRCCPGPCRSHSEPPRYEPEQGRDRERGRCRSRSISPDRFNQLLCELQPPRRDDISPGARSRQYPPKDPYQSDPLNFKRCPSKLPPRGYEQGRRDDISPAARPRDPLTNGDYRSDILNLRRTPFERRRLYDMMNNRLQQILERADRVDRAAEAEGELIARLESLETELNRRAAQEDYGEGRYLPTDPPANAVQLEQQPEVSPPTEDLGCRGFKIVYGSQEIYIDPASH